MMRWGSLGGVDSSFICRHHLVLKATIGQSFGIILTRVPYNRVTIRANIAISKGVYWFLWRVIL